MDSKDYYGEEEREDMLSAFARLTFHLRRGKGENGRAFLTKFDSAERQVSTDHKVQLPADYLGFLLITALLLDDGHIKMLLNFTKGDISVKAVKNWLRVHETNLNLGTLGKDKGKSSSIMYAEQERQGISRECLHETLVTEQAPEDDCPDPELELLMTAWK